MRTGAVIVAAGHKSPTLFRPMMPVGDTTVIRRIIIILQQAGGPGGGDHRKTGG